MEGGIEAAYKRRFDAEESVEAREKLMADLVTKFEDVRSPLKTANKFGVEEIIDPRDTRLLVCEVRHNLLQNPLHQLIEVSQVGDAFLRASFTTAIVGQTKQIWTG